jgi:hypothetical protein
MKEVENGIAVQSRNYAVSMISGSRNRRRSTTRRRKTMPTVLRKLHFHSAR